MTYAELVSALRRSGFDFLETTDLQRFVREAADELTNEEPWPWRYAEAQIADGADVDGPVEWLKDSEDRVILPIRQSELVERAVDLEQAGNARWYYREDDAVKTWPAAAGQLTVAFFDRDSWTTGGAEPSGDTDTPRAPARWHDMILLLARLRAKEFNDDYDEAGQLWQRYQARLEQARQAELVPGYDEPDVVRMTEVY